MKIALSHPLLKTNTKFSSDEKKFIQLLEGDADFENLIINIRKKIDIPEKGFNISEISSGKITLEIYIKLLDQASYLTILYGNLPQHWIYIFIYIILFNIAIPSNKTPIKPIEIKSNQFEVTITIKKSISVRKIRDFIYDKQNKLRLDKMLKSIPTQPKIGITNIIIKNEMLRLKKDKKSDEEIGDFIENKYKKDISFSTDYANIRSLQYTYKKFVKNILNRDEKEAQLFMDILDFVKKPI